MSAICAGVRLGIGVLACNVMLFMVAVAVAIGDPIIFLLNQYYPRLFEVADFKFFNLVPTIFILEDGDKGHV